MSLDVPNDIAHMTEIGEKPPCPHCGAENRSFCKMKLCEWPIEVNIDKDEDIGS